MPVLNLSYYMVIAAWFGNLKVTLRSQLNRLVCTAMKVVGLGVYPNFQTIFDKVILKQAMKMTQDPSHVFQREFELLPSGRRFVLQCLDITVIKTILFFWLQGCSTLIQGKQLCDCYY